MYHECCFILTEYSLNTHTHKTHTLLSDVVYHAYIYIYHVRLTHPSFCHVYDVRNRQLVYIDSVGTPHNSVISFIVLFFSAFRVSRHMGKGGEHP